MVTIRSANGKTSRTVNTICESVEDLGIMATTYGPKPMLRFTFESDEVNEFGSKRRYTRLFHKHGHEKSSLSIAVKSWTGRDLSKEADDIDDVNWDSFTKVPARLTIEPGSVKNGKRYENIMAIEGVKAEVPETEPAPEIEREIELTEELICTE